MRVAIVADVPWPSGSAGSVRVRRWAEELADAGCEVCVFPVGHYGPTSPPSSAASFAVAADARFHSKYGTVGSGGLGALRRIRREIIAARPDWLLCYGRRLSTVAACSIALPDGVRIALDMCEHAMITLWERGVASAAGWDHYFGSRLLLARADAVFAITPALGAACRRWTRAPIVIVPGMITATTANNATQARTFGYFGGWHAKDAPEYVIAMVSRMFRINPTVRFETIGRVPDNVVAQIAAATDGSPRVVHLGVVPDARLATALAAWWFALLPRADAASARFAFPNRVADLLASGTPVLVRASVGIANMGEEVGIVSIAPTDPMLAADQALAILADANTRARLSAAAHAGATKELAAVHSIAHALNTMRRVDAGRA